MHCTNGMLCTNTMRCINGMHCTNGMLCTNRNLKMIYNDQYKMGKGARLRAQRMNVEVELATRIARLKDETLLFFLEGMMQFMKSKQKREVLSYLRHKNGGVFKVIRIEKPMRDQVVMVFTPHETPGPFTLANWWTQ